MKAHRRAFTDHNNLKLEKWWERRQNRKTERMPKMTEEKLIETFARMWMQCDPNRGGSNPDELMPMAYERGGTDEVSTSYPNPLGGQPHWKWFIPRAEASLEFLKKNGVRVE